MKYLPRPLTALLVAMLSLALTGGDLMAAKKDKGKGGSGKKEHVQKRGGSDRGARVAQSRRSAPRAERRTVTRAAPKRSAPKPKMSKPSSRDMSRLAAQRSRARDNDRKRSDAIVRHQLTAPSSRDRAADAKRKTIERSQNVARTRDRDNDRDRARVTRGTNTSRNRADVRREIDRRAITSAVRRDNDADRNRVRDRDSDRHRHSHRDRSHYTVRHDHDHHSHDWYRSRGYVYDYDYYRTYHRHRYYNDALGVFLFSLVAPPAYVYESAPYAYDSSSVGYGYDTRVAVQEELARAGYYDGTIDGVVGPGTRSAIYAYQQDYGLYASGRIDDQLLQSLGLTTY